MSNIIPPLLSNTPPPPPSPDDDEDDEFGDFIGTNNLSYGCESLSLPTSPVHSTEKVSIPKDLDIMKDVEFSEVIHTEDLKFSFENDLKYVKKVEEPCINEFTSNFENYKGNTEDISVSIEENFQEPLSESIPGCISQGENEDCSKEVQDTFSNSDNSNLVVDKPLNGDSQFSDHIELFCDDEKVQKNTNLNKDQIRGTIDISDDNFTNYINYEEAQEKESEVIDLKGTFPSSESENQFNKSKVLPSEETSNQQFDFDTNFDKPISSEPINVVRTDKLSETFEDFFAENNKISVHETDINAASTSKDDIQTATLDDDFDDFADFRTYEGTKPTEVPTSIPVVSQTSSNTILSSIQNIDIEDDDFGDFTSSFETNFPEPTPSTSYSEPSTSVQEIPFQLLTEKQALEKAKKLFDELFPLPNSESEDFCREEIEKKSNIFDLLKDVTDTPALSYQWPKSASQKLLLKALNIDERNILPPWNSSMPIFAYNLGLQPLEPTKSEVQSSLPQLSPSSSSKTPTEDIPSAQFDWKGSGLENPLDVSAPTPAKEVLDLDFAKKDQTPSHVELPQKTSHLDAYGEFSSHCPDPPQAHNTWANLTPLRETYISNHNVAEIGSSDDKKSNFDEEVWLSSTSYNAEVPSWTLTNKDYSETKETSNKNSLEIEIKDTDEDDFDDFQTASFDQTVTGLENPIKEIIPPSLTAEKTLEEDDFTDFQFSTPVVQEKTFAPPSSILEPLKPVPVYQNVNQSPATQINWPDPGITDEEITKLEEVFCKSSQPTKESLDLKENKETGIDSVQTKPELVMPLETKRAEPKNKLFEEVPQPKKIKDKFTKVNFKETPKSIPSKKKELDFGEFQSFSKPIQTTKVGSKQSTLEDEEWSDFVSAQKASPVHKLSTADTERTSSPDLPLSVFNLGSIQPAKQPIPVITPQGLVQTKLSANMSDFSPKTQLKTTKPVFHQPPMTIQPSLISSQYATQAYKSSRPSANTTPDDVEWGEFVSNPLPAQQPVNGYQNNSWTNFAPNIITNPGHCVQSVPHITANSKKNMIPNLVLPELDFVAPKSRTYTTRKK